MTNLLITVIAVLIAILCSNHGDSKVESWSQKDADDIHDIFANIKTQEDYDRATYIGINKDRD